jgi:hypothetical protein
MQIVAGILTDVNYALFRFIIEVVETEKQFLNTASRVHVSLENDLFPNFQSRR